MASTCLSASILRCNGKIQGINTGGLETGDLMVQKQYDEFSNISETRKLTENYKTNETGSTENAKNLFSCRRTFCTHVPDI